MRIYVASSWRNTFQPSIVHALRRCGHDVYDFKNSAPGNNGFAWSSIDPEWKSWDAKLYREALKHPIAQAGYALDIGALKRCEACVLVLPSGRSASWEFGYAMGQGKPGCVVQFDAVEPELMYREAEIVTNMEELFALFGDPVSG
jgi:nucleoside 2-deoxyribosyltransferase